MRKYRSFRSALQVNTNKSSEGTCSVTKCYTEMVYVRCAGIYEKLGDSRSMAAFSSA